MCGICGEWNADGINREKIQRMAQTIRHRGPDDEGFYFEPTVGLASRRLSIIDLDTGGQPIANENSQIWIVFNGEIYNYPELREHLIARGHTFRTHTDTEVILHLYEEYGVESVKRLRGMFTFAIWDKPRQRLFIARDPLGQKHLYYCYQGGCFTFGSEIKPLLIDVPPQLNTLAMHHLLSLRCIPDDDTLFVGVCKLPAGHSLLLEDGTLSVARYWELRYEPKLQGTEADLTEQLRELLVRTVQSHLLSDVPLGAFLSGGIDSSLVTAIMATLSDQPVKTFSIGVREDDFNELPYARMVAKQYHTEHHEFIVESNLIAALPTMMWHMEEPVDPFAFGVYSVSKLAAQHVKVALGGDGGDEMFAGYDRYFGNQIVDLYRSIPAPVRQHAIEPVIKQLPDNFSYNNKVQKLRWLASMSKFSAGERYAHSASFLRFHHAHKQALYTERLWAGLGSTNSVDWLTHYYNQPNAAVPVDKMLFTDVQTRLADHLLMVNDRMTMAHSLEGRSPYVDHQLVEFVAALPAALKLKGRRLKHILREVAKHYLPETLVERPKQGFSFPLAYWFRGELRIPTQHIFAESQMVEAGYFRKPAMQTMLDEHATGKTDHNYRLWLLLNMELWYRQFISGVSPDDLQNYLVDKIRGRAA
jgi:asparagine synthase (glutamine-hydrolysing)